MKKNSANKANKETYHLLVYVLDSEPKIKKFKSKLALGKFVDKFVKDYPDYLGAESGNWVDYAVTDVIGEVTFFTDGLKVE